MRILLVYGSMQLGGVQTLILRICRHLATCGYEVTLFLEHANGEELLQSISRYARVVIARRPGWWTGTAAPLQPTPFSYIYCFDMLSLLRALTIQQTCSPGAKVLVGVYFPREYCWRSATERYVQRLTRNILRQIPEQNVVFMNTTNAIALSSCLGRRFDNSPIVPIPIEVGDLDVRSSAVNRRRIVSVGRVTDFKTYNFHMLDVIRVLRARGFDCQYDIYGWGDDESLLRKHIVAQGVSEWVHFHGPVRYSNLKSVLQSAFLFVGMGTALLEAAALGIPSLVAVESASGPMTYGFLHELPEDENNLGETDERYATYSLIDRIEWLYARSPEQYDDLRRATFARAQQYSLESVMARFISAFTGACSFSFPLTRFARLHYFVDLWRWRVLKRLGVSDPLEGRYLAKSE